MNELEERLRIYDTSRITAITFADHALYQQFFDQDQRRTCYGNSLIYLTQACRGFGMGLKYADSDVLLSIGCHRGHYVIVRPLGVIDQRIIDLLSFLREVSGKPVFLKKLFPDQVQQLRQLGDFADAGLTTYPWDLDAFADDDTYPEIILDVSLAINATSSPSNVYQHFIVECGDKMNLPTAWRSKKTYRRWIARVRQIQQVGEAWNLIPYHDGLARDAHAFLQRYFAAQPQNVTAYENMLGCDNLHIDNDQVFRFVAYWEGHQAPVGLLIAERLDSDSAGAYAHVVSRSYPGLSECLLLHLLDQLRQAGIRYLNVGGSETMNQDRFKRTFIPVESRPMSMLVYGVPETRSI